MLISLFQEKRLTMNQIITKCVVQINLMMLLIQAIISSVLRNHDVLVYNQNFQMVINRNQKC